MKSKLQVLKSLGTASGYPMKTNRKLLILKSTWPWRLLRHRSLLNRGEIKKLNRLLFSLIFTRFKRHNSIRQIPGILIGYLHTGCCPSLAHRVGNHGAIHHLWYCLHLTALQQLAMSPSEQPKKGICLRVFLALHLWDSSSQIHSQQVQSEIEMWVSGTMLGAQGRNQPSWTKNIKGTP